MGFGPLINQSKWLGVNSSYTGYTRIEKKLFGLMSQHFLMQGLATGHGSHQRQMRNTIKIVMINYENLARNLELFEGHNYSSGNSLTLFEERDIWCHKRTIYPNLSFLS